MVSTGFKGYVLGIIAAATYGTIPLFTLPLYDAGLNADSILVSRYVAAILILGIMLKMRGHRFGISRRNALWLIGGGILMSLSSLTLFEAYNYMPAGIASTLIFAYPVIVAAVMAIFFRERMGWLSLLCLLITVGGIALLCKAPEAGQPSISIIGILLSLASALFYALYIVYVNKSPLDRLPTLKVTFYVILFGSVVFLSRFAMGKKMLFLQSEDWLMWGNILALALISTVISFLCTTAAIQSVGATITAILGAFEPLTAIFFGITVFDEVLLPRQWVGVVLVIGAVLMVVGGGASATYIMRLRKMFPRRLVHRRKEKS